MITLECSENKIGGREGEDILLAYRHFGGPGGVTVSFFGPAWGLQNHAQCEELSASGGKRKGSSGGSGFALRRLARRPAPGLSHGASASHRSLFLQVLVQLLSQRGASLTRLPRTLATLYHATTAKLTLYPGYRRSILLEVVTRYEMY